MTLTVQLFARARELAKADDISIELPPGATVRDLRLEMNGRYPELGRLLAVSAIAVNHEFASESQALFADDEVALIPPVSGGSV